MNLLQERIEELGSAILNTKGDHVYITGFYNSDRLFDWLNGIDCWQSKGLYDKCELDFFKIKDNAIFIVMEDDLEIKKFQFVPLFKGLIQYDDSEKKTRKRTFTLRKCQYSGQYNVMFLDENNEKQSLAFEYMLEIESYLLKNFRNYRLYTLDNKVIKEGFDYVKRHDSN